jgi:hypothetical protein
MHIKKALTKLDPANDEHWTTDGLPLVDFVQTMVKKTITREDITNAAPDLTRHPPVEGNTADAEEAEAEAEAEEVADPVAEAEDAETDDSVDADEAEQSEPANEPANEPATDPADPDYEEDPDIMGPAEPLGELQQLEAELEQRTVEMYDAQRAHDAAKIAADKAADAVNALNRKIEVFHKQDPNHGTAGIRAYLAQQNKNRLARAQGMQRFMETTGMHPKDVHKAIDPKAPIDKAMATRKPARGTARPTMGKL